MQQCVCEWGKQASCLAKLLTAKTELAELQPVLQPKGHGTTYVCTNAHQSYVFLVAEIREAQQAEHSAGRLARTQHSLRVKEEVVSSI